MSERLCKDCKWAKPDYFLFIFKNWEFAKCHHPEIGQRSKSDLVTGKIESGYWYCSSNRMYPCATEGKFWEQRK